MRSTARHQNGGEGEGRRGKLTGGEEEVSTSPSPHVCSLVYSAFPSSRVFPTPRRRASIKSRVGGGEGRGERGKGVFAGPVDRKQKRKWRREERATMMEESG